VDAGGAGGSAADKARLLREKAAKLEAQADQWARGAEGERRTRDALTALAAWGYVVLHDLSIPGSRANIDHVVIGPTGVTVIDSKLYSGRLNVSRGVVWHGRYPLRREMEAVRWETTKVREAVADAGPGWTVPVRTLVCIHGATVPADQDGSLAPVVLCGPQSLVAAVTDGPPVLGPSHVAWLEQAIRRSLPASSTQPDSLIPQAPTVPSHVPSEWVAAEARNVAPRRRRPQRTTTSSARAPKRAQPSSVRALAAALGALILLVVGLGLVSALVKSAVGSTTVSALPPPPGSPGSPAPPTNPVIKWSCPTKGRGWTALVSWTGSATAGVSYQTSTAALPNGPWTALLTPATLTASAIPLAAGVTTLWMKVNAAQTKGILTYRSTSATASARSPSTAC
jgi:Nuclease-related domain